MAGSRRKARGRAAGLLALGLVGAALVGDAGAMGSPPIPDRRGPGGASRELFGPLIEHHKAGLARSRGESRERRGAIALLLRQSQQEFDRAAWSTWLAWVRPRERGPGIPTHWQDAEAHLGLCIERLAEARDRLPDLSWSLWMARDHARMVMCYRALLAAGAREIPPLPPGVVAEREAAEARYRRMLGNPKLELPPEPPPPGLLPRAPRPGSGPARRRGLPNTRERAW